MAVAEEVSLCHTGHCCLTLASLCVLTVYSEYSEMYNFAGQNGVFEVRQTTDEAHGKVNRQVVLHDPVYWCNSHGPTVNIGGDATW